MAQCVQWSVSPGITDLLFLSIAGIADHHIFCPADIWSTHSTSINLCRRSKGKTTWRMWRVASKKAHGGRDFWLGEVLSNLRGHSIARYESELWSAFLWVHIHMHVLPSASSHNMQNRVIIAKRKFHCNIQNNQNNLTTSLLSHGGEAATLHVDWCMC